jgi:hypothetical protein
MAICPYSIVFLFQESIALSLGIGYVIPWAAITIGLAILLTGLRYFHLNGSNNKKPD